MRKKRINAAFLTGLLGCSLTNLGSASFTLTPSNNSTTFRVGVNTHFRVGYRLSNAGPSAITNVNFVLPANVTSTIAPFSTCTQINSSANAALTSGQTCTVLLDVLAPPNPQTLTLSPLTACVGSACVTSSPSLTLNVLGSPNYFAFVSENTSNSIKVIDAINDTVVTTLSNVTGANYLAVSHNGRFLYADAGGSVIPYTINNNGAATGAFLTACTGAQGIAFNPDDTAVFVSLSTANVVKVISLTGASSTLLSGGSFAGQQGLAVSPDGSTLVVASNGNFQYYSAVPPYTFLQTNGGFGTSNQLNIAINPMNSLGFLTETGGGGFWNFNWVNTSVEHQIIASSGPVGVDVSRDGQQVWASTGSTTYYVADATVNSTAPVPYFSFTGPAGAIGQGVSLSPDGKKAYIAIPTLNQVLVYDTQTITLTQSSPITAATGPQYIAFMP